METKESKIASRKTFWKMMKFLRKSSTEAKLYELVQRARSGELSRKFALCKGFTIIEVLVAASIVAIVCVGAFSLLTSSNRQSERASLDKEAVGMVQNVKNCLRSFGSWALKSIPKNFTGSVNLGTDNATCATGSYNVAETFPGIVIKTWNGNSGNEGGKREYKAIYVTSTGSEWETVVNVTVKGDAITRTGSFRIY